MTTFTTRPRRSPPDLIVVHESGGPGTPDRLVAKLQSDGNGVHYIVGRDGRLFELADPETEVVSHISSHNPRAIGVELPNPVGADSARGAAFARALDRQGTPGHIIEHSRVASGLGNRTVFYNPLQQCEAFYRLIRQLMRRFSSVPARIGPLSTAGFLFGRQPTESWAAGGLFPHGAWAADGHFDGFFPILYLVARQSGLAPEAAWSTSIEVTEAAVPHRIIDLAPYFKSAPPESLPAQRAQALLLADRSELEQRARERATAPNASKAAPSRLPTARPAQPAPAPGPGYNSYTQATVETVALSLAGKLYNFDTGEWT